MHECARSEDSSQNLFISAPRDDLTEALGDPDISHQDSVPDNLGDSISVCLGDEVHQQEQDAGDEWTFPRTSLLESHQISSALSPPNAESICEYNYSGYNYSSGNGFDFLSQATIDPRLLDRSRRQVKPNNPRTVDPQWT